MTPPKGRKTHSFSDDDFDAVADDGLGTGGGPSFAKTFPVYVKQSIGRVTNPGQAIDLIRGSLVNEEGSEGAVFSFCDGMFNYNIEVTHNGD